MNSNSVESESPLFKSEKKSMDSSPDIMNMSRIKHHVSALVGENEKLDSGDECDVDVSGLD